MAEMFNVRLVAVTPQKGRIRPRVRLHIVQLEAEASWSGHPDTWKRFAGRLLWDSGIAAFRGVSEPWNEAARFPFVFRATIHEVITHDLIALIGDHAALARLAELTDEPELVEYGKDDAEPPQFLIAPNRAIRAHYSNYLREATVDISLSIDPPAEMVAGSTWTSTAY
jgi:hypothetical protein